MIQTSLPSPTRSQRRRFEILKSEIGCIACVRCGVHTPADIHHILVAGRRKSHDYTIPLCPWHHRGIITEPDLTEEYVIQAVGPSLARDKRAFIERFGDELELLETTETLLVMHLVRSQ